MIHEHYKEPLRISYSRKRAPNSSDFFLCLQESMIALPKKEMLEAKVKLQTVSEILNSGFLVSTSEKENYHRPETDELQYLFSVGETAVFTLLNAKWQIEENYDWILARETRSFITQDAAYTAILGNQFYCWYERNRFCGKCGKPMVHTSHERRMECKSCGNFVYPQICPCVIVGVLNEGKLLVTKYNPNHPMMDNGRIFPPVKTQTLVSGYIEMGETAEDAVKREVWEEVHLKVKNIRPYQTAPWPISGSLLIGFLCDVDGEATICEDSEELKSASWYSPDELEKREDLVGLTSEIIERFRLGKLEENGRRKENG